MLQNEIQSTFVAWLEKLFYLCKRKENRVRNAPKR